jgi:thioredoxin
MAEIRVVTDATFEEMVLKNERPVVVDFWATWCGPCKMVAPEMEKIAAKYDGHVDVVKVDVDANPGLSRAFNIMSIPTIAFFKPGSQPQGVVGFRPMEQLEQQFGLAEFSGPAVAPPAASETTSTEPAPAEAPVAEPQVAEPKN